MGKQLTDPQKVSQEEFDKDLDDGMNILLKDGADDKTIKLYVEDYKSRFQVKKKEDTTLVSENTTSDFSNTTTDTISESDTSVFPNRPQDKKYREWIAEGKPNNKIGDLDENGEAKYIPLGNPSYEPDEEVKPIIESYKNTVKLTDEEIQEIDNTIENEKNGKFGLGKSIADSFRGNKGFLNPFFNPSNVGNNKDILETTKRLAKERGVSIDKIPQTEAEEIYYKEKNKSIRDAKIALKAEEFIENLSPDDKRKMEKHLAISKANLSYKEQREILNLESLGEILKTTDEEYKRGSQELIDIIKNFDNTIDYSEYYYNYNSSLGKKVDSLDKKRQSLIQEYEEKLDNFNKTTDNISTVSNELDLFKRNYGKLYNFKETVINGFADIGANGLNFVNEASKDLNDYLGTSTPISEFMYNNIRLNIDNVKENIEKTKNTLARPQSLSDIQGITDAEGVVEWALNVVAEQTANTVILAASGGSTGLVSLAVSSTGGKLYDLEQEEIEGQIKYTKPQKWGVSFIAGGLEIISEKISLKQINKSTRVFNSIGLKKVKEKGAEYFKEKAFDELKEWTSDVAEETLGELLSDLGGKYSEEVLLGKEVNYSEGLDEVIMSSALMSGLVYKTPILAAKLKNLFVPADVNQKIYENTVYIARLSEQLNDISNESQKNILENKITELGNNNISLINKSLGNLDNLTIEEKKELIDLNNDFFKLRQESTTLEKSQNIKDDVKEKLIDELKQKAEKINIRKEEILNKGNNQESITSEEISNEDKTTDKVDDFQPEISDLQPTTTDKSKLPEDKSENVTTKKEPENKVSDEVVSFADELLDKVDNIEDVPEFIERGKKATIGNSDVIFQENGDTIKIEEITTPQSKRGQGSARNALQQIITVADNQNKTIELEVVPLEDTTNVKRLIDFYESEGFTKEKDFTENGGKMTREPNQKPKDFSSQVKTFFDPLESEGESLARLSENITETEPSKKDAQIKQVAKESTASYIDYLKEQNAPKEVMESEFVKTFESRLIDALNKPDSFDSNQKRSRENGSRIDKNGNEISELEYLTKQNSITSNTSKQKKESIQKPNNKTKPKKKFHKINNKEYSIELSNGNITVKPRFGKNKISPSANVYKQAREIYIENTDFSKGEVADANFQGTANEYNSEIANKSKNPLEVATALDNVRKLDAETSIELEITKDSAIAESLKGVKIDKKNHKEVTDLSLPYRSGRGKETKTIDEVREIAETILGEKVDYQDVLDFLDTYSSVSDFNNKNVSESQSLINSLESKFKELTGLKPSEDNVSKVIGKTEKNPIDSDDKNETSNEDSSEVPFQTESNQERIKGQELTNLVDRLKATGLASNVEIINDSRTKEILESLGVNDRLRTQSDNADVNLENWIGNREILSGTNIQDAKTGQPIVAKAYHGTTNEFYEFDATVKGNIEGHLGAVNYFTSDKIDANQNYQSDGADLTSRIEQKSEMLDRNLRDEFGDILDKDSAQELSDRYGIEFSEGQDMLDVSREVAESELKGDTDQVLEVYIRMDNPVVIGKNNWIDAIPKELYEDSIEDATQEIADENNITIEDAQEDYSWDIEQRAMEIEGVENPIIEALQDALNNNGYPDSSASEILNEIGYESEISLDNLEDKVRKGELYDNYDGELASSQVIADMFENLSYDGIILTDVSQRFKNMGISSETSHIHIFNQHSNNIKLADGTNTTFNENTKDIRYQNELSENGITLTPNGFVYNNTVYLNSEKVKRDTPIHEFAHLWNTYSKENHRQVYDKGLELIENSVYHEAVKNNPAYNHLSKEGKLEEALAQAIGEKGVKILNESLKAKFSLWFNRLFSQIARGLGLKNLNGKQLADLTLDKFTDLASAELLSGKNITGKTDVTIDPKTNIEYVIDVQEAIIESRQKVVDAVNTKNIIEKDVKDALYEYINENLNRANIKEASKSELERIIKIVAKAKTEANFNSAISRIDKIVDSINKKEFAKHYETLKSREIAKQKLKDKKVDIKLKIELIKDYRKNAINKKWLSNITFSNIDAINKAIAIATEKSLENAINKIDEVAKTLQDKYNEQQAKVEHKSRTAKEKIENRKLTIKARKKYLIEYMNLNLDNKNVNKLSKAKIVTLIKSVADINTDKQLMKKLKDAEKIITIATNEVIISNIDKVLDKKIIKRVSGRATAVNNSDLVDKVFNEIKINVRVEKGSPSEKTETLLKTSIELEVKREVIYEKIKKGEDLTDKDFSDLLVYDISINMIEALTTNDYKKANSLLYWVQSQVESFYQKEQILHKEQIQEDKRVRQETIDGVIDSIKRVKGEKEMSDIEYLNFNQKNVRLWGKLGNIGRFLFSPVGYVAGSLDALAGLLDRDSGTSRSDGRFVQFVDQLKKGMQSEKARVLNYNKKHYDILKSIYGSVFNQDKTLNKEFEIQFKKDESNDYNIGLFTRSELINVYQIYQNENLRSGLAKRGFTDKIVEDIQANILTDKDIQYADELFKIYENMYIEENEIYKSKYYTEMPKADFYAGKVFRENQTVESIDDIKLRGKVLTTTHGSQKSRVANDKAIQPQNVGYLFKKHLIETSHFIHNSYNFDTYSKLINDNNFKKTIIKENPKQANEIFDSLEFYQNVIANGSPRSEFNDKGFNKVVEVLARNYTKAILAINPIAILKQATSIVNGSADMPSGKGTLKTLSYYADFKRLANAMSYLKENSEFYRIRYNTADMDLIQSGLSSTTEASLKIFNNSTLEASRKLIARGYSRFLNKALFNIKSGDSVGVLGVLPVYLSWVDTYQKQGMTPEKAKQEALKKFEITADRTQQSQSDLGKSRLQLSPYGRYFAMFKSTQIQNIGNTAYHFSQIIRKRENAKGSRTRNALAIVNLQLAQPMLYYYITFMMLGSIREMMGYEEDEEAKAMKLEIKKGLITTGILGNYGSVPIFSETAIVLIDKIIANKEDSFGGQYTTPIYSSITKTVDNINYWNEAKSVTTKQKYEDRVIKGLTSLGLAFPEYLTEVLLEMKIYTDEETNINTKLNKLAGYSNWVIEQNTNINVEERNILLKLNKKYGENRTFKGWEVKKVDDGN